jgi:hypothetical protein
MTHVTIGIETMLVCAFTLAGQAMAADSFAGPRRVKIGVLAGGIGEDEQQALLDKV